jgi:hypothetical protein
VPNWEKDELTHPLETPEHHGWTWDKGLISWRHGFPKDAASYRSHQRRKDKEAKWIHGLEGALIAGVRTKLRRENVRGN